MPERAPLTDPVLGAVDAWRGTTHPSERLDALILAFEITLRVDALLLAAGFLREPRWRDARARSLLRLRQLTLGQWWDLLGCLASSAPTEAAFAFAASRDFYRAVLRAGASGPGQKLIALRNPRAHDLSRTTASFVAEALAIGEPALEKFLALRPQTPALVSTGPGTVECGASGELGNVFPLILAAKEETSAPAVFLFSGWRAGVARWESTGGKEFAAGETSVVLARLLDAKTGSTEILDASSSPTLLLSRAVERTRASMGRLVSLDRYRPECALERPEGEAVVAAFAAEERPLLIVDGPAGAGKTTFLAQVADRLAPSTTVLLEAVERLTEPDLPGALGRSLGVRGDVGGALDAIARHSPDGRLWLLLDDAGATGRERRLILSLVSWLEAVGPDTPLRVVLSIRSDRLRPVLAAHGEAIPPWLYRRYTLPPFELGELIALATRLPVPEGEDVAATIAVRRELAARLGRSGAGSVRRPGLAVPLLEASSSRGAPAVISATALYEKVLNDVILERASDGHPSRPGPGRLARQIALALLSSEREMLPLLGYDSSGANLIDPETGRCHADLEVLLADGIVREIHEDFETHIAFSDERLFEFLAATGLGTEDPEEVLRGLVGRAGRFPPAMLVAAFYASRLATRPDRVEALASAVGRMTGAEGLLRQVASLGPKGFLEVASRALRPEDERTRSLVSALVQDGEPHLAAQFVSRLLERSGATADPKLRLLKARALFETDGYRAAGAELDLVPADERSPEMLELRAEVSVALGEFDSAVVILRELTKTASVPAGSTLRSLGYALGRLGRLSEAEPILRAAIAALEPGPSGSLSEAWGDLGELLLEQGRLEEARDAFRRGLDISRQVPTLMGTCIGLGLLGALETRAGNLAEAEDLLERSLALCRRIGNLWREAFLLGHLADCVHERGDPDRADCLRTEEKRLRDIFIGDPEAVRS